MFTGIIQAVGTLVSRSARAYGARLVIDTGSLDLADVAIGDSIAVGGVCLTVVIRDGTQLGFDASAETLRLTTLGAQPSGARLNLEKSLRLADRLGGHLVSGHVDGIGAVLAIGDEGDAQRWSFRAPAELLPYLARKGSIGVDGVSLTVSAIEGECFEVSLIPHTLAATSFAARRPGEAVNLEVDMIARYVERLMSLRERGEKT